MSARARTIPQLSVQKHFRDVVLRIAYSRSSLSPFRVDPWPVPVLAWFKKPSLRAWALSASWHFGSLQQMTVAGWWCRLW